MKKLIGLVVIVLVVLGVIGMTSSNKLLPYYNGVRSQTAQVQNVLSRQAQLIPNMAEVAKSYGNLEQSTFVKTAEARSQKLSGLAKTDPTTLAANPDLQKQIIEAQKSNVQALTEINAAQEAYPELKANQNFQTLMAELSGSINRVTVERRREQQKIEQYNNIYGVFPGRIFYGLAGYREFAFYQAGADEQSAPKLDMGGGTSVKK